MVIKNSGDAVFNAIGEDCVSGKKIVLFATSGGSGFGNTVKELKPSAPNADITEGKLLNRVSEKQIADWVKTL